MAKTGPPIDLKADFPALHEAHVVRFKGLPSVRPPYYNTADYLIGISATWKGSKGPSGKIRRIFEQVSKLPRRQQKKVVEFVEAFVQHKATAG